MWVLLRFITVVVVYAVRFLWRRRAIRDSGVFDDTRWVSRPVCGKKGKVRRLYFGLPFEAALPFVLTRESGWDRWFKMLGLAHEIQTGDERFDGRVYVACDHPLFRELLQNEQEVRTAVVELFGNNVDRIFTDGAYVWATLATDRPLPRDQQLATLRVLQKALIRIDPGDLRVYRDRFFWKALAVEAAVWSLASYAAPGFFEMLSHPETLYPTVNDLITASAIVALVMFLGLLLVIVILLRGSSRGHRVIAEGAIVLLVGLPLFSIQAVSDVNIHLDESTPHCVDLQVRQKVVRVSRGRRGRTTRTYYLHLFPPVETRDRNRARQAPRRLKVDGSFYSRVPERGVIRVTTRSGALGFEWIESIELK